jgi:NADPH:quinone reductase-like Zn-dependent oxidoreductase
MGETKSLQLDYNLAEPTAADSPSPYIIRTKATALTRGELAWPEPLSHAIPVPGYDLAGVVISTPTAPPPENEAYVFKPGDEIYAMTTFLNQGNARETSVAQGKEMALKPRNISWEEAATVPLSALSAWQALFVHGKLSPNFDKERGYKCSKPRVLITAASGGVGVWGVQLAHLAGAEVVGTCGPSNVDFVRSLGADTVLDYTETKILDWVSADTDREARGFDVVLDCIGGQTLADSWKCARNGGRVISVAEPPESRRPVEGIAEGVDGVWFIVSESGVQLAQITELIEGRKCRAVVDNVYGLEEWKDAFGRLEGGHAKGKVVLRVD